MGLALKERDAAPHPEELRDFIAQEHPADLAYFIGDYPPQDAWRVMEGLYKQSQDFSISRIYPGIPEYFDPRGRGLYPYLTGSAAWYIFTLLTESFGIKGRMGDLVLQPKLVSAQFSESDQVKVSARIASKRIEVTYHNPRDLSYGEYHLKRLTVNGKNVFLKPGLVEICFPRQEILTWQEPAKIFIELG